MLRPYAAPKLMCAHRGLVFQLFAHITVGRDISEQVNGIEPSSSAWKADALAVVLHLHSFSQLNDNCNLGPHNIVSGPVPHVRLRRIATHIPPPCFSNY